jgi:hypothetical protein
MSDTNPPLAFFDTLEEMPNPFKQPLKSLGHLAIDAPGEVIDDYQCAAEFIYSYRGSPDTFSTYRREIEHFLHWCLVVAKKSLKQVVREDIETYVEFSKQPPPSWVGFCYAKGSEFQTMIGVPMSMQVASLRFRNLHSNLYSVC